MTYLWYSLIAESYFSWHVSKKKKHSMLFEATGYIKWKSDIMDLNRTWNAPLVNCRKQILFALQGKDPSRHLLTDRSNPKMKAPFELLQMVFLLHISKLIKEIFHHAVSSNKSILFCKAKMIWYSKFHGERDFWGFLFIYFDWCVVRSRFFYWR